MSCVELTILTIMNLLICFTLGPISSFATLKVGSFCFLFSVPYCRLLQASLRVESGAELTEHVLGLVLGLGHHAAAHIGVVREGEVAVLQTAGVAGKHLDHVLRLHWCCKTIHRFLNRLSQSHRRPLLGPSPS